MTAQRRRYNVGASKLPAYQRTIAHAILPDDEAWTDRGYLDVIGSDSDHAEGLAKHPYGSDVVYSVELTDEEAERFASASNLRYLEESRRYSPTRYVARPTGPLPIPTLATLAWLRARYVDLRRWHGRDVRVAVLDQGTTKAVRDAMGIALVARTVTSGVVLGPGQELISPDHVHGCLVAPNAVPASGQLLDGIVTDDSGAAADAAVAAGVRWAVDNGAKVINISLSAAPGVPSQAFQDACAYARDNGGAQIVIAAGNDNLADLGDPSSASRSFGGVHSSIAFDESTDRRALFSNHAADGSGCSTGVDVTSLDTYGRPVRWNGTSASAPHMVQLMARALTGAQFTPAQVGAAFKANPRDTGASASEQGGGAYDLHRALTALGVVPGGVATRMGYNWPNAVVTYVNHWDQQSTSYANRTKPFVTARTNGVQVMRTFFGTIDSVNATKSATQSVRDQAWAGLKELLDTAATYGVRMVLSNYLTQETIQALAGTTYASWTAARQAITTSGSAAWNGLQAWLTECLTRFANHPGVFSWEVVNEPGYMLGMDDGSITRDAGCAFLDYFQSYLKTNGALKVNAGGRALYDKSLLTNAQAIAATNDLDYLDDHFYPTGGDTAATHLAAMDTWVARVTTLLGRAVPVIIGEYGTDPQTFFDDLTTGIVQRGWMPIAWGYDSWDTHIFNESAKPYVLSRVAAINTTTFATPGVATPAHLDSRGSAATAAAWNITPAVGVAIDDMQLIVLVSSVDAGIVVPPGWSLLTDAAYYGGWELSQSIAVGPTRVRVLTAPYTAAQPATTSLSFGGGSWLSAVATITVRGAGGMDPERFAPVVRFGTDSSVIAVPTVPATTNDLQLCVFSQRHPAATTGTLSLPAGLTQRGFWRPSSGTAGYTLLAATTALTSSARTPAYTSTSNDATGTWAAVTLTIPGGDVPGSPVVQTELAGPPGGAVPFLPHA